MFCSSWVSEANTCKEEEKSSGKQEHKSGLNVRFTIARPLTILPVRLDVSHCIELLCRIVKMDEDVDEASKKGLALLAGGLIKLKHNPDNVKARLDTLIGGCYSMDGKLFL